MSYIFDIERSILTLGTELIKYCHPSQGPVAVLELLIRSHKSSSEDCFSIFIQFFFPLFRELLDLQMSTSLNFLKCVPIEKKKNCVYCHQHANRLLRFFLSFFCCILTWADFFQIFFYKGASSKCKCSHLQPLQKVWLNVRTSVHVGRQLN